MSDHPVDEKDVVHVEDGGWVNPDGDFGSPQSLKWNYPLMPKDAQVIREGRGEEGGRERETERDRERQTDRDRDRDRERERDRDRETETERERERERESGGKRAS